jgi:16S rRNA U516 pseudouridylate synthase RsuA-like enzyme
MPGGRRVADAIVSLPRALSKLGSYSRSQAAALIAAGRVSVNGKPAHHAALRADRTSSASTGAPSRGAAAL